MSFAETVRPYIYVPLSIRGADSPFVRVEVTYESKSRNAPVASDLPAVQNHINDLYTRGGFTISRPALAVYVQYDVFPPFISSINIDTTLHKIARDEGLSQARRGGRAR